MTIDITQQLNYSHAVRRARPEWVDDKPVLELAGVHKSSVPVKGVNGGMVVVAFHDAVLVWVGWCSVLKGH